MDHGYGQAGDFPLIQLMVDERVELGVEGEALHSEDHSEGYEEKTETSRGWDDAGYICCTC